MIIGIFLYCILISLFIGWTWASSRKMIKEQEKTNDWLSKIYNILKR